MYKIRYKNNDGIETIALITDKRDLNKISKSEAKDSIIETKIDGGMPISLHNAIADHNSKVRANSEKSIEQIFLFSSEQKEYIIKRFQEEWDKNGDSNTWEGIKMAKRVMRKL